ncbi:MAG: fluoroacetyl-CoA thioesterase [Thermosediminibacterales bacterium]|nr:fluoroacetyl-CoA thioesterase [Thermosediminibacterales bacterium]MDK2836648.1 fluoroacetyl-CoA thioesterase [Thermosediminibacterales bacterium]
MKVPEIKPNSSATVQKLITEADTALHLGSGALKTLLATPTLSALMIEAAVKAVDHQLPKGLITIGKTLTITHNEPTTQGMTVTVKAKLIEVSGNRLRFNIYAYDEIGLIGSGCHDRYIVSHQGILKTAEDRKTKLFNPVV